MRISGSVAAFAAGALAAPAVAHAQEIPPAIAVLAISPILVIGLSIALGAISRSWKIAVKHAGIVAIWVMLFAIASFWVENDLVIWTPIGLLGAHAVVLVVLISQSLVRRIRRALNRESSRSGSSDLEKNVSGHSRGRKSSDKGTRTPFTGG